MNRNTLLKSIITLVLLVLLPSMTTAATETITWIHTDHLGSPIAGRDAAGETTWEQAYAPWGERQAVAGMPQAPAGVGYTGHVYDEQVGLIYAGARWYDPEMGRFISPDAVRFSATRVSQFNRYAYANNNPASYVDPDGNVTQLRVPYAAGSFIGRLAINPLINHAINVIGATTVTHTLGTFIYDVVHNESAPHDESPKPGDAFPDEDLPRNEDGTPKASVDEPHTQLGQKDGRKGRYPQAREFDGEGNPVRDIDFTDHGRGHPSPHQHPYKENPTGGTRSRGGYEPL